MLLERIANAKSIPYFIRDNQSMINKMDYYNALDNLVKLTSMCDSKKANEMQRNPIYYLCEELKKIIGFKHYFVKLS